MLSAHFACISSTTMKSSPIELSFSALSCIYGCLALLCLPLEWLISVAAAAAIHELCHILLLKILHIPIFQFRIEPTGAIIQTANLLPVQEFFCAAAGPAGSFLCLFLIGKFPLIAFCGLVQGLFNLLPIYPMDGGRMLRALTQLCAPRYSDLICKIAKYISGFMVFAGCFYLHICTLDSIYILLGLYFLFQTLAKRRNIEYNIADF